MTSIAKGGGRGVGGGGERVCKFQMFGDAGEGLCFTRDVTTI